MGSRDAMGAFVLALAMLGVFAALACGPMDSATQASQPAESAELVVDPHERSVLEFLLEAGPDAGIYVSNADAPDRVRTDAGRFSEDYPTSVVINPEEEYELQLRWNRPWGGSGMGLELYVTVPISGAGNPGEDHGE